MMLDSRQVPEAVEKFHEALRIDPGLDLTRAGLKRASTSRKEGFSRRLFPRREGAGRDIFP